jgi:hyperosmotically inducible periplasmic protein
MKRSFGAALISAALVLLWTGCSQSDQDKARERAAEARRKAREEAHELAHEAKRAANAISRQINQATNDGGPRSTAGDAAGQKLRRGGDDLRSAGDQAKVKLDRAALIAKVKAKLASDVGLSTVTSIDVDDSGQVVTLRGTVDTPEQKKQAEYAVRQVDGVTQVVNDLQVKP